MQALIYDGRSFRIEAAAPEPVPEPGEAVIRPTRVLIGAADRAVAAGRVKFTGVMGHRFVGIVERLAPRASGTAATEERKRWEGKRVVGSISTVCGTCEFCKGGLSNHCASRKVLGLFGRDGCLADRFTLPAANLVEVPKNISDDAAAFAEPIAAAAHAAQMVRLEGKPYVTILGDGVSGLLAAQIMAKLNASVRVLGRVPARFTLCERWGIRHRHIDEAGRRADQNIVIDATNSPDGLAIAMQLVRPRGTIVMLGVPAPVPPAGLVAHTGVDLSPAVCGELNLVGSRCGRINEGIDVLARGGVEVLPLISRRFKFADAELAMKHAIVNAGEDVPLAVIVERNN
jgi:alcohol dehydrogenase